MADNKLIKQIAEHYGYEPQSRQLIEEMAELIQALNKMWRYSRPKDKKANPVNSDFTTVINNVFEEIADVEICLQQVKLLLDCEKEVEAYKEQKINRQIERIKAETR